MTKPGVISRKSAIGSLHPETDMSPLLDSNAVQQALIRLNQGAFLPWQVDNNCLQNQWTFADFQQAFAFMTDMAKVAEQMNHHPHWTNVYRQVQVMLSTHDAGGLTELDFALAHAMQAWVEKHL